MRRSIFLRLLLSLTALAVPALAHGPKHSAKNARRDILYVCACGDACACGTVALKPGTCGCGKALQGGHVVEIDQDDALLCMCGVGCSCEISSNDATKCACGKPLKRAKLKGTGIYFCNCGGTCTCNTVDAKPAKCGCGMTLHKVG